MNKHPKTKLEILDNFKILYCSINSNKFSIEKLCKHCHISRSNFYYHYNSFNDLILFYIDETFVTLLSDLNLNNIKEIFSKLLATIESENTLLKKLYNNINLDTVKRYYHNFLSTKISNIIDEYLKNNNISISDEYKIFLCEFYTCGINGIIWNYNISSGNNSKYDESHVINYINNALKQSLIHQLDNNINR